MTFQTKTKAASQPITEPKQQTAEPTPRQFQSTLQQKANASARVAQLARVNQMAANYVQRQPNRTGMPDKLKNGIENLSGMTMDDVKVHYNSAKPAQLQAHAYAQGTDIHLAPGQEKHLPHEAWHVVQQKQGRVQPTMQMKGVQINDNESLEREADVMGLKSTTLSETHASTQLKTGFLPVVQLNGDDKWTPTWNPFWRNFRPPLRFHRRHMIPAFLIKTAINSVFDNNCSKFYNKQEVVRLFQDLVKNKTENPTKLKRELITNAYNNKFNIFLGDGRYNSTIGKLSDDFKLNEPKFLSEMNEGIMDFNYNKIELSVEAMMPKIRTTNNERDEILTVMQAIICQDLLKIEQAKKLNDKEMFEMQVETLVSNYLSFYDTMSFDPSQASDDDYRKDQNASLIQLFDKFHNVIENPELDGFEDLMNDFMGHEHKTLELRNKMGSDEKFIEAISEKSGLDEL